MIGENLWVALGALQANKMRSVLTMLGIIIGVGGVILLIAIGDGVKQEIVGEVEQLGTDLLFVLPGRTLMGGLRGAMGSVPTLTYEDAEAISDMRAYGSVVDTVPYVMSIAQVVAGKENLNLPVEGVTANLLQIMNWDMVRGEFFTQQHVQSRANVAVLIETTANNLFRDQDPVDQWIAINGVRFKVIGVLKDMGNSSLMKQDVIEIPITTFYSRISSQRTSRGELSVSAIYVKAAGNDSLGMASEEVRDLLRKRHRIKEEEEDDFNVTTMEQALDIIKTVTNVITTFLASIAAIALLVGGIGIMNIMLVSVTERTREIGIRKAVGAKRRDILAQFVVEASVLSLVGGLVGIGLGWVVSVVIGVVGKGVIPAPVVSLPAVVLAVTVSVVVGLFFGIYPAARAARLNPIDALRYE